MDIDKAFSHDDGFLVDEQSSGPFYTGGATVPYGQGLPFNTFYIQTFPSSKYKIWVKIGAGDTVNDWECLSTFLSTVFSETLIFQGTGTTPKDSFLTNQGLASNVIGLPVGLGQAFISNVSFVNKDTVTGNILIKERFPAVTGTWTTIHTMPITNVATETDTGLNVSINQFAEISVFTDVSVKDAKAVIIINGSST